MKFARPVGGVHSRQISVDWAGVPETPIHKNRYSLCREHDVSSSPQSRKRARRNSVSQTSPPKLTPQGQLGGSITAPLMAHASRDCRCGGEAHVPQPTPAPIAGEPALGRLAPWL